MAPMMTKQEVQTAVREMQQAEYGKAGLDFWNAQCNRIEANGWKLCLEVTNHIRFRTKTKKWLKTPKTEFYVRACFVNLSDPREWVFYYENKETTKHQAQTLAEGHEWPTQKPLWQL